MPGGEDAKDFFGAFFPFGFSFLAFISSSPEFSLEKHACLFGLENGDFLRVPFPLRLFAFHVYLLLCKYLRQWSNSVSGIRALPFSQLRAQALEGPVWKEESQLQITKKNHKEEVYSYLHLKQTRAISDARLLDFLDVSLCFFEVPKLVAFNISCCFLCH
ncbi:unnamed protein product [Linum trigynum]|uniref:Uncharacterized protein n=1 Tax=Linum trigynum TaxID=586398 RepID=A0AAV2GEZ7_9ROSI